MACACEKNVKNLLLVEGRNDCHTIMHLCRAHGLPEELFCIHDSHNDDGVLKELRVRLMSAPDIRPDIIGIILDADKPENAPNIESRFHQITDRMLNICNEYSISRQPCENGTIIPSAPRYPKVGIWLMPNNRDAGMLEDFIMELARKKNNASLARAEECVARARKENLTSFKPSHYTKAIVHTYLAWHTPEPGCSLGQAITARTLEPNTDLAKKFVAWLRNLFNDARCPS